MRTPLRYPVPQRSGAGRQCEESGYPTQDDALDRLTQIYKEKRSTSAQPAEMKRTLGNQRFGEYADTWLLRLTDREIEAVIEAPAEDIRQFREVLAQVLGYGRADAVPIRVGI
ncbi:hypothetical protein ACFVYE_31530 [Streptomyces sp. NPDC058239]|uniref:hypothetical protein n=1 Tax=Streptomyces sp. NPDC058239 TaxID=3346395 RepID=UPI0036F00E3F